MTMTEQVLVGHSDPRLDDGIVPNKLVRRSPLLAMFANANRVRAKSDAKRYGEILARCEKPTDGDADALIDLIQRLGYTTEQLKADILLNLQAIELAVRVEAAKVTAAEAGANVERAERASTCSWSRRR
jgi:hypothetical protein